MTSQFLKCLDEQLDVFLNMKQQKLSQLKTEKGFLSKNIFV